MPESKRWRTARFHNEEELAEFLGHAEGLEIDGLEVERVEDSDRVRFSAPARVEVGIAQMIAAHGGKLVPCNELEAVAGSAPR